jgi:hypothetical protein
MGDLKDFAIAAHGWLDRWNQLSEVRAHLLFGGVAWALKKQDGVINDSMVLVELHRQFASYYAFGKDGLRTSFIADRVAIETTAGQVVAERSDPRAAFDGHVLEMPWDRLHLAYFLGYALWNYLTTPFSFAQPGYMSEELDPWRENGQTWRRLKVKFPAHIATHCAEQVFHFGADGLLRRHDYIAEVVGPGAAAHYISEYREFDGVMVPTRRRVHPVDAKGNVANEAFLVTIELDRIDFI